MPISEVVAAEGAWGKVLWARDARGRLPARDFFNDLSLSDRTKVMALFRRLADLGPSGVANREKFKSVGQDLWEFKSFQIRLLGCFRPNYRFVLAHGVIKKKDRLDPPDIARANRILAEDKHQAR